MCGICGIVGSGNHDDILKMMKPLTHRGPDGQGCGAPRIFILDTKGCLSLI